MRTPAAMPSGSWSCQGDVISLDEKKKHNLRHRRASSHAVSPKCSCVEDAYMLRPWLDSVENERT